MQAKSIPPSSLMIQAREEEILRVRTSSGRPVGNDGRHHRNARGSAMIQYPGNPEKNDGENPTPHTTPENPDAVLQPVALRQMFHDLVGDCYGGGIGIRDTEVTGYVADVLTEFCASEKVYGIRDQTGRPLKTVGEMLLASDPVFGSAYSFDRERAVRKHIGHFTLFFAGLFPEGAQPQRRHATGEGFLEMVRAGKESYYIVSQFDLFEYASEAPLFAKLAQHFESCIYGLNLVRDELERRKVLLNPAPPPKPKLLM